MTQEIAEHLRKLSSRNGRYWLRDSRQEASGSAAVEAANDLPFGSVKSNVQTNRAHMHESVVVSIPDVTTRTVDAVPPSMPTPVVSQTVVAGQSSGTRVDQQAPAIQQVPPAAHTFVRAKLNAQMPALAPVGTVQSSTPIPKPANAVSAASSLVAASQFSALEANGIAATPPPVTVPVAAPPTQPVAVSPPSQPAVEPPAPSAIPAQPKKVAPAPQPQEDDAVKAARATQSNEMESSISKIAEEILTNYPVASSSVIMLSGSQSALHADETCARVAAELASRNLGRVLLIDSDFNGRRLTKAGGMDSQGGLSEIMNIAYPWQDAILKSGSSKLDFMAAGKCPHKRWTPKRLLREALAEIRNEYQFVCVSTGDAHGSAAALWAELSDGALLVVSASQSSEAIAQSAVGQLKANGARMLGCVVADFSE